MILTAHQPLYLGGWLGLFDKIASADAFVIFDVCPAEDSGFENRNRILTNHGPLMLTVPIRRSRELPLSELLIVNESSWARKHFRSIEAAYHKAPFWEMYGPDLEALLLGTRWEKLVDLDEAMLRWAMSALALKQPVIRASTLGQLAGTKSELVLSMCKAMGAKSYLFGEQGRNYADLRAFAEAGIEARFQAYKHPTYPQTQPGMVEKLCVVDLLMNMGPRSLEVLQNA